MRHIKIHRLLEPKRAEVERVFQVFHSNFGQVTATIQDNKMIGEIVTVQWVCLWNNPNNLHQNGILLATDGKASIICFNDEDKFCIYNIFRNEDLTPTGVIRTTEPVISEIA